MKHKKKGNIFAVSLDIGDNIIESLRIFCLNNKIKCGFFNGIGAVDEAELAHYSVKTKKYTSKKYKKALEIVSLNGNISSMNKAPYIHCHACFSDEKMIAIAGHLKEARVSAACEVIIVSVDLRLERKHDKIIGLNMLDI